MKLVLAAVGRTIKTHKLTATVMILLSLLLGAVPVIKSTLESALIGAVDNALRDKSGKPGFGHALNPELSGEADLLERLTSTLFGGLTIGQAVIVYLGAIIAGGLLACLAAGFGGSLGGGFFQDLYRGALVKAFTSRRVPTDPTNPSGQQANALQMGANSLSSTASSSFSIMQTLVAIVISVGALATVSWSFLWLFVFVVLLLGLVAWRQARKLDHDREKLDLSRNKLTAYADDVLSQREVILTHERQDTYSKKLGDHATNLTGVSRRLGIGEKVFESLGGGVQDLGLVLVLVLALLTIDADSRIAGAYFVVSLYQRLSWNIRDLVSYYDEFQRSKSQSKTFLDLLGETSPLSTVDDGGAAGIASATSAIEFDKVRFGYSPDVTVLDGCTFSVPRGGMTLLVGPSGCGKSTISRLVIGFLSPSAGRVLVDGLSTQRWSREDLWQRLSYVPQNPHVLDESVRDNMFAPDGCSDEELLAALRQAGLDAHDVGWLSLRAKDLSPGQQQRLALARLLVDRSPIVVMDEPLTGVDVFTFNDLRASIDDFLRDQGRTVLVVSHRMAFTRHARHVVVLDAVGRVVEEGDPRVLVERGGVFARLLETARSENWDPAMTTGSAGVGAVASR
jgi:ABC-type multidrug transport system fused ATPase/permease subunit